MKTIKILALTGVILLFSSCKDRVVVPDSEQTGEFLEQDLHTLYLRQQIDLTNEKIKELNPNNPDDKEQIEVLEGKNEKNQKYLDFLKEQTESIFEEYPEFIAKLGRRGPIPPAPSPCNCLTPINLSKLIRIVRTGEVEGFSASVFSGNKEIFVDLNAPEVYENSKLSYISLNKTIDFQGKVTLKISKFFQPLQQIISYSVEGGINL